MLVVDTAFLKRCYVVFAPDRLNFCPILPDLKKIAKSWRERHRAKKKKMLCCPHPTKIKKLGRSVGIFFFFYVPWESWVFQYKFLNGENSGGMQSKRIYKSCKCFFKPLNTNFSKFFAQIWHKKKKKKKKNPTLFFRILRSVGRNFFFFWPSGMGANVDSLDVSVLSVYCRL